MIIGEGASGGALGIGVGDKILMLNNSWYSVISPENCSTILWGNWDNKETEADSLNTYDFGKYYVILPNTVPWSLKDYLKSRSGQKVEEGFSYNSGTNTEWETIDSLRKLIVEHVDPNFKP